jgi:hypothetical protein
MVKLFKVIPYRSYQSFVQATKLTQILEEAFTVEKGQPAEFLVIRKAAKLNCRNILTPELVFIEHVYAKRLI